MGSKFDRWTTALSAALVVGALLACKKKEEPPPPVATPTPTAEPPKEEPKKEEPKKKKDEVKRYPDKETEESGTVRVLVHNLRVYNEADETTDHVATLNKGTLVNRLARMSNWLLIDYPTGVGELSPGWVKATTNYYKVETKIKPEDVKKQDAGAVIVEQPKPDAGTATAPKPDAGTTAAKPDAAATVKPKLPILKLPPPAPKK
jgi:hypothetical protein